MSNQQTLQQQRAHDAYKDVTGLGTDNTAQEYGTVIRGFPALIQTDGLATALAFLQAKGKSHHKKADEHISKWVLAQIAKDSKETDLLQWLLTANTFQYRQATAEALAYVAWLKRFVEANNLGSKNKNTQGQP